MSAERRNLCRRCLFCRFRREKGGTMQKLLAITVGVYLFFRIRRLLKFYGVKAERPAVAACNLLAACWLGGLCLDLWTVGAMLVLHFAVLFALADILALSVRQIRGRRKGAGRGRVYVFCARLYRCGIVPVGAAAILFGYGFFNMGHVRQTACRVTTDKNVGDFRVILLADIHYGTIQHPDILKDMIPRMNALDPDLVVLAGDIVEEGTSGEDMREVFRLLGGMESRYGVYYVYGNHDRQPYAEKRTYTDGELKQAIEDSGIHILRDRAVEIGEDLILAGREDAMIARYLLGGIVPPGEILGDADRNKFLLMVSHEPVGVEEVSEAGVDLLLCGHTHGGQLFPVGLLTELTGGLNYGTYQSGNCQVIVSSGVAGWGYPIRTQEHCEYVVVDITSRGEAGQEGAGDKEEARESMGAQELSGPGRNRKEKE